MHSTKQITIQKNFLYFPKNHSLKQKNPVCARLKEPIFYQKKKFLYWQPIFEHEEKEYYKPVKVSCFWSSSHIEYESNGDRNKALSIEEYLNKSRPYLKNVINHDIRYLIHEKCNEP